MDVCMFAMQSFKWSISLMLSQQFFCLECLMDEGAGQAQDLASARHAWLSFWISVAISRSVSQFSSFVESHPWNVVMSWSKDLMRFVCHCVVHKVFVYLCIAMCRHSSLRLAVEHVLSVTVSWCNLLVSCTNFSAFTCGLAVGSNWVSSWKCSCNSAGLW